MAFAVWPQALTPLSARLHPGVANTFQIVCIHRREAAELPAGNSEQLLFFPDLPLSWAQTVAFGAHYTASRADVAVRHPGGLSIKNRQPHGSGGLQHEIAFHLYVMPSFISAFRWRNFS